MDRLAELIRKDGFENFGFAELTTPFSIDLYDKWIDEGFNGEMDYLERHKPDKRDPRTYYKRAKSAIVVTIDYIPHPAPKDGWPLSTATHIAAYARGRDYHRFFHTRLRHLCSKLVFGISGRGIRVVHGCRTRARARSRRATRGLRLGRQKYLL